MMSGTHNSPVKITVRVSPKNSRVIRSPSNDFESRHGTADYSEPSTPALCADLDVAAGRVLDRRHLLGADGARGHLLGVQALQPLPPVGPPRTLVFGRALHPVGERNVPDVIVCPVLVLTRCRW